MYVLYHSRDLDGYCSGAICKKKYPDAILIGYDYGQPIPMEQIKPGQPIIIVDVRLPMETMVTMGLHSRKQFTWIDHHQSAILDYQALEKSEPIKASYINAVLKQGISACELTWQYLFPEDEMPVAVSLLGQFDTWRNENVTNWELSVLPFQYGMKVWDIDTAQTFPPVFLNTADKQFQRQLINNTINDGAIALSYQKNIDKANMKSAFEVEFEGLKAIACNGAGLGSMAFDSVPGLADYDLMMPFKFNGQNWSFSLYTAKDNVDCSVLAKKYGGGGHAAASGFIMDELPPFITNAK